MIQRTLQASGRWTLQIINTNFDLLLLSLQSVLTIFKGRIRIRETIHQCYELGNKSISIVLFAITFSGFVVALEYSFHMRLVLGTAEMVPAFAALMIVREIAPGVTCLLLTTKIGAGIAAEVGTMKVTEQIDALRLLQIEPIEFLVVPRLIASILVNVCLVLFAVVISITGAGVVAVTKLGFTPGQYFHQLTTFLTINDNYQLITKAAVFGAIMPLIACYYGLKCKPSAEGVGEATTNAVVISSILIIALDFVITTIFSAR